MTSTHPLTDINWLFSCSLHSRAHKSKLSLPALQEADCSCWVQRVQSKSRLLCEYERLPCMLMSARTRSMSAWFCQRADLPYFQIICQHACMRHNAPQHRCKVKMHAFTAVVKVSTPSVILHRGCIDTDANHVCMLFCLRQGCSTLS